MLVGLAWVNDRIGLSGQGHPQSACWLDAPDTYVRTIREVTKLLEYLGSDAPRTLVTPMNKAYRWYSRGNCIGYAVKPPAVCAWGLGVKWNISKEMPYRMVRRVAPTHVWPPQDKHKGPNVNGNLTSCKCFSGHAWDHTKNLETNKPKPQTKATCRFPETISTAKRYRTKKCSSATSYYHLQSIPGTWIWLN